MADFSKCSTSKENKQIHQDSFKNELGHTNSKNSDRLQNPKLQQRVTLIVLMKLVNGEKLKQTINRPATTPSYATGAARLQPTHREPRRALLQPVRPSSSLISDLGTDTRTRQTNGLTGTNNPLDRCFGTCCMQAPGGGHESLGSCLSC